MITVRSALVADATALAELSGELGYACTPAEMEKRLTALEGRADHRVFVALSDDQPCGWLQTHCLDIVAYGFRAEILGLVVSAKVRRQGVGQRLVAAAEAWALLVGAASMAVRSNAQRTESHYFYPAVGYQLTKTSANYRKALVAAPAATPPLTP